MLDSSSVNSCFVEKITDKFVACSDVHLIDGEDFKAKLLLDGLQRIDPSKVECLVLNGDIFDFCFGAHTSYFLKKFKDLGDQIQKLALEGVKVFFVQGNHEFDMQYLPWKNVEFVIGSGQTFTLSNGVTLAFCHGDLLYAPWHYHIYSYITRTRLFSSIARWLPPKYLDHLALAISSKSRQKDKYRKLHHRIILSRAYEWLKASQADHGIIGHFHVPYFFPLAKKHKKKIVCVDSWVKPNFLTFDGQNFKRLFYSKSGKDLICDSFNNQR